MQLYDLEDELAPSAYFRSPVTNFSGSNGSVTHNKNAPSHFCSLFSSPPGLPELPQENTSSEPEEPEELEPPGSSHRPQRSVVKPTNYAKLHNP